MNELTQFLPHLAKPYAVTRSRLGAITKVYDEKYIFDLDAMAELLDSIHEKLLTTPHQTDTPKFSSLISYSDQTHQDGALQPMTSARTLPTGKTTERVVMQWRIKQDLQGQENELSITIRVSNPINPLMLLQAALSKSPNDIDNIEFAMGSTCATVDGANQAYADEIFLRVKSWISARKKPHPFLDVNKHYKKWEWWIDQLGYSLLPTIVMLAGTIFLRTLKSTNDEVALVPLIIAAFFVIRTVAGRVNADMARWALSTSNVSQFLITNGDQDALTERGARIKNSAIKLIGATSITFVLNVAAGIACWWLTRL